MLHLLLQEASVRGSFSQEEAAILVRAIQANDPDAFEKMVALIRKDLWNFLVNQRIQQADAEDLFQDVLMKLFQKIKQLEHPEKFRSWLFAIALNAVRSGYRRKQPQSLDQLTDTGFTIQAQLVDADRQLAGKERLLALRKVLQDLPERELQIILLDRFAGLPQAEIADWFDLNLNTLKTLLRRTRVRIIKAMKEAGHV
jgi:RNA polymerase sigma-70 factor (ECF subfamily)